jgi:uncharacterized protein YjbI with pentapeptide repeats
MWQTGVQRLKLWAACAAFGAAYGSVYGAVWQSILWLPVGVPLWVSAAFGAIGGGVIGAIGGGVMGAVLLLVGKGLGWAAASVLGGLVPGLLLINLNLALPKLRLPNMDSYWTRFEFAFIVLPAVTRFEFAFIIFPAVVAAFLGIAIARALATGRSRVPGVQRLATVVSEVRSRQQDGSRPGFPAEVTPARPPAGRGDEATPFATPAACNLPVAVRIAIGPDGLVNAVGGRPEPEAGAPTRRPGPAALLTGAGFLLLCFTPLWIAPYYVARTAGVGPDLSGTFLPYAPLKEAKLRYATLNSANLTRANLSKAELTAASMVEANLRGANLSGALLTGASLGRADLRGADLCRADLRRHWTDDRSLFDPTYLVGADLRDADLRGALYDAETHWPDGFDPQRHGALLIGPRANLFRAQLRGLYLTDENLAGANLAHADLRGSVLTGTILRGADLRGANLETAALAGAVLTGARYDARTRWPTDFDPRQHGTLFVK